MLYYIWQLTPILAALSGINHQVDSVAVPPPPSQHTHAHTPNPQSIYNFCKHNYIIQYVA